VGRTSITSCLLILVLFTSTLGCVTGGSGKVTNICSTRSARHACHKAKPGIGDAHGAACGETLSEVSAPCNLRSFLQVQIAVLPNIEMPSPALRATGEVSLPSRVSFIVSSVGSPQTDRGPPLS